MEPKGCSSRERSKSPWFFGVERLTLGPIINPLSVHLVLLGHEVVFLESTLMGEVPEGSYFLVSAPVKYGGIDGAQARPLLLDFEG